MGDPVWIGLDLGHERAEICAVNGQGKPLLEVECAADVSSIEAELAPYSPEIQLIAVEAGLGTHLVRKLRSRGLPVEMFESRKASKFLAIRRNKTDSGDAKGLADLARLGIHTVSRVHLTDPQCEQLRSQLKLRSKLVQIRVMVETSIRSRLRCYGMRVKVSETPGVFGEQVSARMLELLNADGVDLRRDLEPLIEMAEALRTHLKELDRGLKKFALEHPVCRRLMEVPGVGPICALSFYSLIENPFRFGRSDDVAAYIGLVPRRYQSGAVSRSIGITKSGSSLVRRALVTSAMVFRRSKIDSALGDWSEALGNRIGWPRARVALARKLAIVLLTMWRNEDHFIPYPQLDSKPET